MRNPMIILLLVIAGGCFAQSARDYYNELYRAGGLDRMADLYVCFFDDATSDTFFIYGESKLFREYILGTGTFSKLPKSEQTLLKKDFLIMRGYVKGVPHPHEDLMFKTADGWTGDKFWFDKATPAQVQFSIVPETLRFKRSVQQILPDGRLKVLGEYFGRCESVASGIQQRGN